MTRAADRRRRRRAFEAQQGRCFYCQRECVLPEDHVVERALARAQRRNARQLGTLEHLYPRGHPKRASGVVMACAKCNSSRGSPATRQVDYWRDLLERLQRSPAGVNSEA